MSKQYQFVVKFSLWMSICLFALRCVISWNDFRNGSINLYDLFGYAGEAIGVSVIIVVVFERWLWRWTPFINKLTPKLSKRYIGTLKSSYDGKDRTVTLEIKQTFLSVRVYIKTNESKSSSIIASIEEILGENQLVYCYLNKPKSEYRNRSEIHYGTAMLDIYDDGMLQGTYYTDRNTRGDMIFRPDNKL